MINAAADLHQRGLAAAAEGRFAEAVPLLAAAVEAEPGVRHYRANLGLGLARLGRLDEAAAAYRGALALAPGHAPTLAKLGRVLSQLGRLDEAVGVLTEAAAAEPNDADTANALGAALAADSARAPLARQAFERAVRLDASFGEAWRNLGLLEAAAERWPAAAAALGRALALEPASAALFYQYGVALGRAGSLAQARQAYEQAVALDANCAEAWNNLGHIEAALGNPSQASAALHRALALRPDYVEARYNLGVTLQSLGQIEAARTAYQLVIAGAGAHADAFNNLGGLCLSEAQPERALPLYAKALAADPAHPEARWNLGLAQLATGDFEAGWPNYEARRMPRPLPAEAAWDGRRSLEGHTMLVWCEQGLGDAVEFLRYLPELRRRGAGRIVVECPDRLATLFARAEGVDGVMVRQPGAVPVSGFDTHVSVMSLPYLTGTIAPELIPPPGPAYALAEDRRAHWRERLASLPGGNGRLRTGIVWGGNPDNRPGLHRSMPLNLLIGALEATNAAALVNLQHGPQCGDLDRFPSIHRWEQTDLADTAALVAELDLVITVDTLMAHLAGTVGRRVWTLLSFAADWRWMTGRLDSPWYPGTMRLFRQRRAGDWAGVMEEVASALRALRASSV